MSTITITGTYGSGYNLSTSYSELIISQTAQVGGAGVTASFNATVVNYGTVAGTGTGVALGAGGSVVNGSAVYTAALISGGASYGVGAMGAAASITNYGTIQGGGGSGFSQTAVLLYEGGSVTNGSSTDNTAMISSAGSYAVFAASGAATIANYGTITSAGAGGGASIFLGAGGSLTNGSNLDTTALISSKYGVVYARDGATITNFGAMQGQNGVGLQGGALTNGSASDTLALVVGATTGVNSTAATITNYGTILGNQHVGAYFFDGGGAVTNGSALDIAALISGATYGVNDSSLGAGAGSGVLNVDNFGTISGATAVGFDSQGPSGVVINGSSTDSAALLKGGTVGVWVRAGTATVINYGTISGGTSVEFQSSSDRLVVEAGSTFKGAVLGGGGTLELAGGTGAITGLSGSGTISGAEAMTVSGFGSWQLDSGGSWTLGGTNTIVAGGALTSSGSLIISAALVDNGTLTSAGTLGGGTTISGTGKLTISGGSATISAGEVVSVANLSLSGGVTSLKESLSYKGAFTEGAAATLTVQSADKLTLTGTTSLGGVINGAGNVAVANATVSGLTIGGSDTLSVTGSITQNGALTIGDATTSAASLSINKGATWTISGAVGIAQGASTASSLKVLGDLIRSGATGVSTVSVATTDTGLIEVTGGRWTSQTA